MVKKASGVAIAVAVAAIGVAACSSGGSGGPGASASCVIQINSTDGTDSIAFITANISQSSCADLDGDLGADATGGGVATHPALGTAQCSGTWTTPAGTWPATIYNDGGDEAGTLCQEMG